MHLFQRLHARCACASAGSSFALAGTTRQYERSRPFRILHLRLDLSLDLAQRAIVGAATLDFQRVSADATSLALDAVGFEIRAVEVDLGRGFVRAAHDYDGDCLEVRLPQRARRGRVRVKYRAVPQRGLYFLAPDAARPELPEQVWSQCQDEDARHWFPCVDKPHMKMTTELVVSVPAGLVALSNGELVTKTTPRGKRRPWVYHFAMREPHPSYLVTLVVGRFEQVEDRPARCSDGRLVPVAYYVPVGQRSAALRSLGETPRIIELFGRLTGVDYPWSRYSQVVVSDFVFGGMENTTATTLYEHVLLDERATLDVTSTDLVAHELAHQWFGDAVTCRDWSQAWLNEGFATFFEHLEREDRLGLDEYEFGLASDLASYLAEADGRYLRPLVCRDYLHPIELFDRHLYEKGALVLHLLRRELGDAVFWRGIGAYLQHADRRLVETNDLQRALEGVSGVSLERFFDQWVYRPGHPVLEVKVAWEKGELSVNARQIQETGEVATFAFPLEVEVAPRHGPPRRYEKRIEATRDSLSVRLAERPRWVAVDPRLRILGKVKVEAPAEMLRAQLESGSTARMRGLAAEALAARSDAPTVAALGRTLGAEPEAWMVRAQAARALGRIQGTEARQHLVSRTRVSHPKVRRAVLAALGGFRDEDTAKLLARFAKRDASYLVQAEAARSLGRTRQPTALGPLQALLGESSWAEVCRCGALEGLSALGDDRALEAVVALTRYGAPPRARRAAVATLSELSSDRKVRRHLEGLLADADPLLRTAVAKALESFGDPRARGPLRQQLDRESDGRTARQIRETLRELAADPSERRRVRDDLEALRGEVATLKSRLSKLETPARKRA
jgi:aminopeptidase N